MHSWKMTMDEVLTPKQVATLLAVDEADVRSLLETGELAGLRIVGQWRVQRGDLEGFLERQRKKTETEVLWKALSDPKNWARHIPPDQKLELTEQDFAPGTFGAFSKRGILETAAREEADNIVEFPHPETHDH